MMGTPLPTAISEYLDSPPGRAVLEGGTIWFRWNLRTKTIESSGSVLRSTPEQMSRPRTTVFVRDSDGSWKRYA
jgi:hypothetical protein